MKKSNLDHLLLGTGKHLFLDLEDTVVTPNLGGWRSVEFMNNHLELVSRLIDEFKPDTVNVFSFAIDDEKDLDDFQTNCGVFLEKRLGFKFTIVPHMLQIQQVLAEVKGLSSITRSDINDFWNKQLAFKDWLIWNQRTHLRARIPVPVIEAHFLDDTVTVEKFEMPGLSLKALIENPVNMV